MRELLFSRACYCSARHRVIALWSPAQHGHTDLFFSGSQPSAVQCERLAAMGLGVRPTYELHLGSGCTWLRRGACAGEL